MLGCAGFVCGVAMLTSWGGLPKSSVDSVVAIVASATRMFADTTAARTAGFEPLGGAQVLDLSPFQGQHWVNRARVRSGGLSLSSPQMLMYAPVRGAYRLVGVAFTVQLGDSVAVPRTLGGTAVDWHTHVGCIGGATPFSLPGSATTCRSLGGYVTRMRLAMVHVWTGVPSASGPYADSNPLLPFLAADIALPREELLTGNGSEVLRQRALAIGHANNMRLPMMRWIEKGMTDESRARIAVANSRLHAAVEGYKTAAKASKRMAETRLDSRWRETVDAYAASASAKQRLALSRQIEEHVNPHSAHGHHGS